MTRFEIEDDLYLPRISSEGRRSSSYAFSPLLLIDGLSQKSFTYNKLPQEPLRLSVVKLDGSCFEIEVMKTATVAGLKEAVESVFSHLPQKGPGKVSWRHLWGHFCLWYDNQKLVNEDECIRNYGIKDGDQLHFVRHVSIKYNLIKRRPKKQAAPVKQPRISEEGEEKPEIIEEDDDYADLENPNFQQFDEKKGVPYMHDESRFSCLFHGWFSYTRLPSARKKYGRSFRSSRFGNGFFGRVKKILRLYSNKLY